jgi:hypothetical protein
VPDGVTHFRLRKGGRQEKPLEAMGVNSKVTTTMHPIRRFTTDKIIELWGYSADYWVQFFTLEENGNRTPRRNIRAFGIPDPRTGGVAVERDDTPAPATPPAPASPMADSMALLLSLKDVTDKDSNARVREAREAHQATMGVLEKMVTMVFAQNSGSSKTDEAIAALARGQAQLAESMTRLAAREPYDDEPEDEPDDDEEEESEKDKLRRIVRAVNKDGPEALFEHLKEESMLSLVALWPKLKAKIPTAIEKMRPLLNELLGPDVGAAPVPAARRAPEPAPVAHETPRRARSERHHATAPRPAPPAPAPVPPDEHTIAID